MLPPSKEEQRLRFLRRVDLADHNWKFSAGDVHRQHLAEAKAQLEAEAPRGAAPDPVANQLAKSS